jgi:DNA-binding MarR family transcriptional regulator
MKSRINSRDLSRSFEAFRSAYLKWTQEGLQDARLSPARMRLMSALASRGPSKMSDLSDSLCVTARNVTGLVDALEAEGLTVRNPHPDDRRAYLVQLTPQGRNALAAAQTSYDRNIAILFDALSDGQRACVDEALQVLMQKMGASK